MTTIKRRTTWQAPPRTVSAFLKALGVYLVIVAALGAWIGGSYWVFATDQGELLETLITFAPLLLFGVFCVIAVTVWLPITSLYNHFNGATK